VISPAERDIATCAPHLSATTMILLRIPKKSRSIVDRRSWRHLVRQKTTM